jgi:hypothetical protein
LLLRIPSHTTTESPRQIKSPLYHRENPFFDALLLKTEQELKERRIRNIKKKMDHLVVVSLSATLLTECSRSARITSRVFRATTGVSIP